MAEAAQEEVASVPYNRPAWSGECAEPAYGLEVVKNGCVVGRLSLAGKSWLLFGRADNAHVHLDHPSVSRYHAVCQYRGLGRPHEIGWYVFDMGSTHGTTVNKEKLSPCMYQRLKVGHVVRFGGSTRLYILQGPSEDEEPESDLTLTKIKELRNKQKVLMAQAKPSECVPAQEASAQSSIKDKGVDWGLLSYGEDEEESDDDAASAKSEDGEEINFELLEQREQYYKDDPKKALQKFFDREGYELIYDCTETNPIRHQWTCRVELPVEERDGRSLVAQAVVTGNKKGAIVQCALEACRLLDCRGLLRKSATARSGKRKKRWEDNDYYDSDEDTFFDRTGELERKRQKRMQRAGNAVVTSSFVDNYESLMVKLENVTKEIGQIEAQLALLSAESSAESEVHLPADKDSLDEYMLNMERLDKGATKVQQSRLKVRLAELKKLQKRTEVLVKVARPAPMTSLQKLSKPVQPVVPAAEPETESLPFTEEIEDEDEEQKETVPSRDGCSTSGQPIHERPTAERNARKEDVRSSEIERPPKQVAVQQPKLNRDIVSVGETRGEEEYTDWLPPEDQSGDGRTRLNDALGY